jgi:hypothetical protein
VHNGDTDRCFSKLATRSRGRRTRDGSIDRSRLVERREAAARKLLQFDWIERRNKRASLPESHLASAAQGDAEALPKAEALPDGCNKSVLPTSALPTDLVPLAPDVVILPSVSTALLSASAPADTAACPNDVVALAGLPAVSASAADLEADVPAGAAELPIDVVESATPIGVAQLTIRPPLRIALMLPKLCRQSPVGLTLLLPIPKRHLLTTLTLR